MKPVASSAEGFTVTVPAGGWAAYAVTQKTVPSGAVFCYNNGAGRLDMCMLDTIHAKRDERKHKAENLWVFGSVARKEERPDSDVDFLVKFNDSIGLLCFPKRGVFSTYKKIMAATFTKPASLLDEIAI